MSNQIDKHCIKLDGSIPYGSPLTKYVYSREALVSSLLSAYMILFESGPENIPTLSICAGLFAGSAIGRASFNQFSLKPKLKSLFGSAHDDLFINKKPDENTIPTKPEHIAASAQIKKNELLRILITTMPLATAVGVSLLYSNAPTPPTETVSLPEILNDTQNAILGVITSSLGAAMVTHYAKSFSTAWRFNQVVRRDWVITDEPPKQTKLEPISKTFDRWVGSPEPEAAATRAALPQGDHPEPVLA